MVDLILLLQADHDIQAAFDRYEAYQPGRGEHFLRQLDVALTLLRCHPELARVYAGPYRRLLVREFPFGIFYAREGKRIVVAAVLDLRQNPRTIRRRLLGSKDMGVE